MSRESSTTVSNNAIRPAQARTRKPLLKRSTLWLGCAVAILALAWFDGGEEPIHQITQQITVPEGR